MVDFQSSDQLESDSFCQGLHCLSDVLTLSFSFFLWTERVGPLEEFPPRNDLIKCIIRKEGTRLREAIATIQVTLV